MMRPTFACEWRSMGWCGVLVAIGIVVLIAIVLALASGRGEPLTAAQAARVKSLARDTGSPEVWKVYQAQTRHGLTERGADKVREAAKATPPPYGLISDRDDSR